jgi:hypothetical protein
MNVSENHEIKEEYREIYERIKLLIGLNSRLVIVENSSEVIEGGIYMWDKTYRTDTVVRDTLIEDYMTLVTRMRLDFEDMDNQCHINSFDHSCRAVLNYLKQDTYVWENSPEGVLKSVYRELVVQYCILIQSVKV